MKNEAAETPVTQVIIRARPMSRLGKFDGGGGG